jgi:hypothetical protein
MPYDDDLFLAGVVLANAFILVYRQSLLSTRYFQPMLATAGLQIERKDLFGPSGMVLESNRLARPPPAWLGKDMPRDWSGAQVLEDAYAVARDCLVDPRNGETPAASAEWRGT